MTMAGVAREFHENIHGDYGTLSTTDCILLAFNVVWILGIHLLSLITPDKLPFT